MKILKIEKARIIAYTFLKTFRDTAEVLPEMKVAIEVTDEKVTYTLISANDGIIKIDGLTGHVIDRESVEDFNANNSLTDSDYIEVISPTEALIRATDIVICSGFDRQPVPTSKGTLNLNGPDATWSFAFEHDEADNQYATLELDNKGNLVRFNLNEHY